MKLKNSASVKIGTAKRRPLIEGTPLITPPPGKYEIKSKIIETAPIRMKGSSVLFYLPDISI